MRSPKTSAQPQAACLTPPGAGGIAVIQIVGPSAATLVSPFLRAKHTLDLARMEPGELRLCRLVDDEQVIDDALVTVRDTGDGRTVVDISLHGGGRIVQRALLMLKRAGARPVEPIELLRDTGGAANAAEHELLPLLLQAKTRPVASWLLRMADRLPAEVSSVIRAIRADDLPAACAALTALCGGSNKVRHLLDGVRVVLVGEPNVGKSTLANALAGREHAIVSEIPGTTRDWVDHAGAIEGVPFTFVDTAGIRPTTDPIEQEAVRRTHEQIRPAVIVVRVIDLSLPPTVADLEAINAELHGRRDRVSSQNEEQPPRDGTASPTLLVWNKSDLSAATGHEPLLATAGDAGLRVSARTEAGLSDLRLALLGPVGLTGWQQGLLCAVTEAQVTACRQALSALSGSEPDTSRAADLLQRLAAGAPEG